MTTGRVGKAFAAVLFLSGCGDQAATSTRGMHTETRAAYVDSLLAMLRPNGLVAGSPTVNSSVLIAKSDSGSAISNMTTVNIKSLSAIEVSHMDKIRQAWEKPIIVVSQIGLRESFAVVHRENGAGADTVFLAASQLRPEFLDLAVKGVGRARTTSSLAGKASKVNIGTRVRGGLPDSWRAKLAQTVLELYSAPPGSSATLLVFRPLNPM